MAWTNLSFAYGSILTSAKMTQLYDNFAAMAAGSAGAPSITANDDIGVLGASVVFIGINNSGASINSGDTVAGSSVTVLRWVSGGTTSSNGVSPSGTLRNISGNVIINSYGGLFQRIA